MPVFKVLLRRVLPSVVATVAFTPVSASAQGAFDMGMLTNSLSQGALIQSEEGRASSQRAFRSAVRTPRTAPVDRAALRYTPSLAVRKRNLAQMVSRLREVDPTGAADLERTFARRDVIGEVGKLMRPEGLDPDNVADAMAMYLIAAYYGVRGSVDSKPSDYKAVSAQLARAISAAPEFSGASDASKQEIAESMIVQAVLVEQAVQAAQKQPSAMPAVKGAIARGARAAFGFDVAKMQLGPNGLD
jgi:hypothetical protein